MSTTDAERHQGQTQTASGVRLAYLLFAGIFAWLGHLIAQSALTGRVCATGELWPMHAVTVGALVITVHALALSWLTARADPASPSIAAARTLGWAGVVINVFNAALIVAEWVPVLFIDPCAGG